MAKAKWQHWATVVVIDIIILIRFDFDWLLFWISLILITIAFIIYKFTIDL